MYWKEVVVLSDYCAIPLDCPLRVKDEGSVFEVLSGLSAYDVSRMAGEVWVKHNHEPRYVNGGNLKAEEINHIHSHFRRNLCVILSKSAAPSFKPWQHTGSYSEGFGYGMPPVPDRGKREKNLLPMLLPMKIVTMKSLLWRLKTCAGNTLMNN